MHKVVGLQLYPSQFSSDFCVGLLQGFAKGNTLVVGTGSRLVASGLAQAIWEATGI